MATVNKTANESNESKLINDNESNDLNDHQHSETSEDQLIKNEMEGMDEEESEDELSVGSPDEQAPLVRHAAIRQEDGRCGF